MSDDLKLGDADHEALAERLYQAIRHGQGIDPPSETIDYGFADAYRIRRKLVDRIIAGGGRPRGHKIGFTSKAMQEMYGMSGPDFGQLMEDMFVRCGELCPIEHLSDTRVEPEIAFEMGADLDGPGVTLDHVLANTHRVWPSIEVIDSRVGAMRAQPVDSIADNAGAGKVVLGPESFAPDAIPLDTIDVELAVDETTERGSTADVMGHPAAAVAWLANKLAAIEGIGGHIRAGDIVMSGSCTRSIAVAPGSRLHARFGPMGAFEVRFE